MNMKQLIAISLCVLMLIGFTACKQGPKYPNHPSPPPSNIELQDATGSVLLGEWTVKTSSTQFDTLIFYTDGSLEAHYGNNILGGVFTDDGTTVSITISSQVLSGAYTVDGDTVTIKAETGDMVLTKAVEAKE